MRTELRRRFPRRDSNEIPTYQCARAVAGNCSGPSFELSRRQRVSVVDFHMILRVESNCPTVLSLSRRQQRSRVSRMSRQTFARHLMIDVEGQSLPPLAARSGPIISTSRRSWRKALPRRGKRDNSQYIRLLLRNALVLAALPHGPDYLTVHVASDSLRAVKF